MYTPIVIKFYFSVNYDEIESNRCSNVVVKYNVNIKVYFYECKLYITLFSSKRMNFVYLLRVGCSIKVILKLTKYY